MNSPKLLLRPLPCLHVFLSLSNKWVSLNSLNRDTQGTGRSSQLGPAEPNHPAPAQAGSHCEGPSLETLSGHQGPWPQFPPAGSSRSAQSVASPVVGHGQGDLKFGQELEVLLFCLLGEARANQQQPKVLGPDHPVLGHRPRALDVEDPLQTLGQPDGVEEVEVPQAVAGVREVQQGACFDEEADGCPGRGGGGSVKQRAEGALGDLLLGAPGHRFFLGSSQHRGPFAAVSCLLTGSQETNVLTSIIHAFHLCQSAYALKWICHPKSIAEVFAIICSCAQSSEKSGCPSPEPRPRLCLLALS